jgi:hypothetical protein
MLHLRKNILILFTVISLAIIAAFAFKPVAASDHDDGEADGKGRNLNLTDLMPVQTI